MRTEDFKDDVSEAIALLITAKNEVDDVRLVLTEQRIDKAWDIVHKTLCRVRHEIKLEDRRLQSRGC